MALHKEQCLLSICILYVIVVLAFYRFVVLLLLMPLHVKRFHFETMLIYKVFVNVDISLFSNRAACHLKLGNYFKCIEDASKVRSVYVLHHSLILY